MESKYYLRTTYAHTWPQWFLNFFGNIFLMVFNVVLRAVFKILEVLFFLLNMISSFILTITVIIMFYGFYRLYGVIKLISSGSTIAECSGMLFNSIALILTPFAIGLCSVFSNFCSDFFSNPYMFETEIIWKATPTAYKRALEEKRREDELYERRKKDVEETEKIINDIRRQKAEEKERQRKAAEEARRRAEEEEARRRAEEEAENRAGQELKNAMALFMIDDLSKITERQLKEQRNRLIKAFHPDTDSDISKEYAQKINAAYDLLIEYIRIF